MEAGAAGEGVRTLVRRLYWAAVDRSHLVDGEISEEVRAAAVAVIATRVRGEEGVSLSPDQVRAMIFEEAGPGWPG
jgi:hypothetical protein